jgi:hypothetical protein
MGEKLKTNNCRDAELRGAIDRATDAIIGRHQYHWGQVVYPPSEAQFAGAIGIVQRGSVEVQDRISSYIRSHQTVLYPVAVIEEGEIIGELEFLSAKYHPGLTRKPPWQAVAGVQTFYVTLLKRSKEKLFRYLQSDLAKAKSHYQCEVLWVNAKKLDQRGLDALQRIALQRLLPRHFTWVPDDAALRRVLGSRQAENSECAIRLFKEILRAMQGSRMVFAPSSVDDMSKLGPWDVRALRTLANELQNAPEGAVLLRPALMDSSLKCGIVLPHFLANTMVETDSSMGLVPPRTGSLKKDVEKAFGILSAFMEEGWTEATHLKRFKCATACFLHDSGSTNKYREVDPKCWTTELRI